MLGGGAEVDGLGGASPIPEASTAADLTANSSNVGNGSAQLSVDDLAAGSHDPEVQGINTQAATAPIPSASLPLPPQSSSPTVPQGYASVPVPGSQEVSFSGAAAPFVPLQVNQSGQVYGQQPQQVVSTAPVGSFNPFDQGQ